LRRERSVGARSGRVLCEWAYEGGRKAFGLVMADGKRPVKYADASCASRVGSNVNLGGTAGRFACPKAI